MLRSDWLYPLAWDAALGSLCMVTAVLVSLAVDRWCGEPPARWHPVVWMGRALGACGARLAPAHDTGRNWRLFWLAALVWIVLAAIVMVAAAMLQAGLFWWLNGASNGAFGRVDAGGLGAVVLRWLVASALLGLLLKPLLALAMLQSEARAVEDALAVSLDAGRARLAWLVSRDVTALSANDVRQSAIESLAENLNDSVVAPLFWFGLAGLPGAALYRFANTADAMWGYPGMHGGRYWQWAGKWAARADDVLSWLPARITALLLALMAGGVSMRAVAREARKTPSPNSGWPMAAMALALGVCLTKPSHYRLNPAGRAPTQADAVRAQKLVSKVALALVIIGLTALLLIVMVGLL